MSKVLYKRIFKLILFIFIYILLFFVFTRFIINKVKWQITKDCMERTSLYDSVIHGNIDTTKYLLSIGRDPNQIINTNGETVLFVSIDGLRESLPERIRMTKLLLENGADPNVLRKDGKTVLDLAQSLNQKELVKLFSSGLSGSRLSGSECQEKSKDKF